MGSIAPLQKLQKKSVHALKRALSDSDLRMGNLCSMGASAAAKKAPTPPHNLEDLLYEMQIKSDVSSSTVNSVIESSQWANKFRQYLRERKLSDDENILRFLVLIHPLKICSPINNNEAPILGHAKIKKDHV